MTGPQSLSLLVAVASRDQVNAVLEEMGYGPNNLSVPCSPTGAEPATHYGAHMWNDELVDIIAYDPRFADLEQLWTEYGPPGEAFDSLLGAHGVVRIEIIV